MATIRSRVDPGRIEVALLIREDAPGLDAFSSCGDEDLDDFLRSDAARLNGENVVRTYLARYDNALIEYVSLLSTQLSSRPLAATRTVAEQALLQCS